MLDGASVRAGTPQVAAQLTDLWSTKVERFDVDGEGVLEVEHFRTAMRQPLHIGPWTLIDFAGPTKAVGLLGVNG